MIAGVFILSTARRQTHVEWLAESVGDLKALRNEVNAFADKKLYLGKDFEVVRLSSQRCMQFS